MHCVITKPPLLKTKKTIALGNRLAPRRAGFETLNDGIFITVMKLMLGFLHCKFNSKPNQHSTCYGFNNGRGFWPFHKCTDLVHEKDIHDKPNSG
jgi:hypothetical protein